VANSWPGVVPGQVALRAAQKDRDAQLPVTRFFKHWQSYVSVGGMSMPCTQSLDAVHVDYIIFTYTVTVHYLRSAVLHFDVTLDVPQECHSWWGC
jgi:hypothetical protein